MRIVRHSDSRGLGWGLFSLTLAVPITLVLTGVIWNTAIVISLALFLQLGTGAIWWMRLRPQDSHSIVGICGGGIALGTLAASLSAHGLRATAISNWGWTLPTVVTGFTLLVSSNLRNTIVDCVQNRLRLRRPDMAGLGLAVVVGAVPLILFWHLTPLTWSGWHRYPTSVLFHEALSHGVHTFGINDNVFAAGATLRYHWLSHVWVGSLSTWSGAESFVVLTRLTPVATLFGSICVSWSWARRLSDVPLVPPLAAVLVGGAGFVGVLHFFFGNHLFAASPSQLFSTLWLLAFSFLLLETIRGGMPITTSSVVLLVMSFGLACGKATNAVVVTGGIAAVILASYKWPRKRRKFVWASALACLSGFLAAYLYAFAGSEGDLEIGFSLPASTYLGLNPPFGGPIAVMAGTFALLLSVGARWMGLSWVLNRRLLSSGSEGIYALGVGAAGVAALILTSQSAGSQMWFVISASAVVSVLSAVGIGELISQQTLLSGDRESGTSERPFWFFAIAAGGVAASVAGAVVAGVGYLDSRPSYATWTGPIVVWLIGLGLSICLLPRWRRGPGTVSGMSLVAICSLILVAASVVAPIGSVSAEVIDRSGLRFLRGAEPELSASTPDAWTSGYREAAEWLSANSQQTDVVASNRQCSVAAESPPECSSFWHLTAALARRRMYIEGNVPWLVIGPEGQERIELSVGFSSNPTSSGHKQLWMEGVRWLWVDQAVPSANSWGHYGVVEFSNDFVDVVRLYPPSSS